MKKRIFAVILLCLACALLFTACDGLTRTVEEYYHHQLQDDEWVLFTSVEQMDEYFAQLDDETYQYFKPNLTEEQRAQYSSDFFYNKALLLVLVEESSGSIEVSLEKYVVAGNTATVTVKELSPMIHTDDMAYYTFAIELSHDEARVVENVCLNRHRLQKVEIFS